MRLVVIIVVLTYECLAFEFHSQSSGVFYGRSSLETHKGCKYVQHDLKEYCANCSYLGLTEVPQYLPKNITCLNLVGNNITHLNGRVWRKYKSLKKLSLARNHLSSLNNGDFQDLSNLEMLDLSLNFIRYYKIGKKAFEHMVSLKYLDLKQNLTSIFKNETYPLSLQHLKKLQTLMIDGIDSKLPYMDISVLYLSGQYGRCNIPHLRHTVFSDIKIITSLFLSNCSIEIIEQGISQVWPNIQDLDLSWNTKLGFNNVTVGLQSRNTLTKLKRLNLNSVYNYYKFDMCSAFTQDDLAYLNDTSLEVFTIESNNLVRVEYDAIPYWPKTLKYVSVRDNMLMYGKYVDAILQQHSFQNIIYYDTSQMFLSHTPNDFVHNNTEHVSERYTAYHIPTSENDINTAMFTRSLYRDYFQILDERLTKFNITRSDSKLDNTEDATNNVEYVDLSENMPGTIMVTLKLFEHSPALKFLNISNNYLGYQLLDDASLFRNYSSLRILDLSSNSIIQLLPGVFRNLINLEQLRLSYNKITNITFVLDFWTKNNLKYLDLSSNHIQSIPNDVRSLMDTLTNFTINIVNNNLRCTCDNLDFLSWMKKPDANLRMGQL